MVVMKIRRFFKIPTLPLLILANVVHAGDQNPPNVPAGTSSDWLSQVAKNLQAREYHITWKEKTSVADLQAAYQAPNRAHNIRTYFTSDGIRLIPRVSQTATDPVSADMNEWEMDVGLTAWGRERNRHFVSDIKQAGRASHNRIEYAKGGITESYVNDEKGLEQIFRIESAPQGGNSRTTTNRSSRKGQQKSENLILELSFKTSLHPQISADRQSVDFEDGNGQRVLRYAHLLAADANGNELESHMELSSQAKADEWTVRLAIDDANAYYPITVDPLFSGVADSLLESNQTNAWFGFSAAGAGDVNGDGYDDVIVGAPTYDNGETDEGAAFIFLGSSTGIASANPSTAATMIESNQAGAQLGYSVAGAGDVNGDGYADVIIGARFYANGQSTEGVAFIFHGSSTGIPNGNPSTAVTMIESNQAGAQLGTSVAGAGDVNGDGYDDVIVGAPRYSNGQTNEGIALVFHGSVTGVASGDPSTAAALLESNQASSQFGISVAGAGDVNGDGYADVIVGSSFYTNTKTQEGAAFIFHGSTTGIASGGPSAASSTFYSVQTNAQLGTSVAGAGDVNGDGYADVIIGAPLYDNGQTDEGAALVFLGSSSGVASGNPSTASATLEANVANSRLGTSVACAGDLNGDGYADVIVGASRYIRTVSNEGAALVFLGSPSGIASGNPNTAAVFLYSGQSNAQFGFSVAGAGDVNGDGYSDILVGSYQYDHPEVDEGAAFIYLGSPKGVASGNPSTAATLESNQDSANLGLSVASAGDVNGDGYADVIVGAPYYDNGQTDEGAAFVFLGSANGIANADPSTASAILESDQANAIMGWSVASAGDVNGDGYADVIVGAPGYANGQTNEGGALIFLGSSGGVASGNPTTAAAVLESDQVNAFMGWSVAGVGDVNGDGYGDVIVGAPFYSNGEVNEGAAFIFHGSSTGIPSGNASSANTMIESNQASARLGYSVAGAGDINGDGFSDVIVGAPYYDDPEVDEGAAFVYLGTPSGIASGNPSSAASVIESNQDSANLGYSVAGAGDVNGDGFADVVVGAPNYSNGESGEGVAMVFLGSVWGLDTGNPLPLPSAILESNQASAQMGFSVAGAGDVNGDGYGDVIVGAPYYANGQSNEGAAFIFLGSTFGVASGNPATASAILESNQADAGLGYCVASAGDVNGDGYTDVIVGAPYYDNGQTDEGAAFVFYGNKTKGLSAIPRQRLAADSAPILIGLNSDSINSFRLAAIGRVPYGKGKVKLQWETKPLGTSFNVAGLQEGASWADTGLTGTSLDELASSLPSGTMNHWRLRILNQPQQAPWTTHGRWMNQSSDGWQLGDVRTVGLIPSPTPTPTHTATPSPSPTNTRTATPTPSPTRTATPSRTRSATPSPSFTRTATDTPTRTATLTPTDTATPSPTQSATDTPTSTATPSPTMSATETPTRTATLSPTRTATLSPTDTATSSPTQSATPTVTGTPTPSPTRSATPTPNFTRDWDLYE